MRSDIPVTRRRAVGPRVVNGERRAYWQRYLFFFQAEDGIRDLTVTGVQTCALPIFISKPALVAWSAKVERELVTSASADLYEDVAGTPRMSRAAYLVTLRSRLGLVKADRKSVVEGKSVDLGGRRIIKKKKREQSVVK